MKKINLSEIISSFFSIIAIIICRHSKVHKYWKNIYFITFVLKTKFFNIGRHIVCSFSEDCKNTHARTQTQIIWLQKVNKQGSLYKKIPPCKQKILDLLTG